MVLAVKVRNYSSIPWFLMFWTETWKAEYPKIRWNQESQRISWKTHFTRWEESKIKSATFENNARCKTGLRKSFKPTLRTSGLNPRSESLSEWLVEAIDEQY